jgi:hypothetical protein
LRRLVPLLVLLGVGLALAGSASAARTYTYDCPAAVGPDWCNAEQERLAVVVEDLDAMRADGVPVASGDAARLDLTWIGVWLAVGLGIGFTVGRVLVGETRAWSGGQ